MLACVPISPIAVLSPGEQQPYNLRNRLSHWSNEASTPPCCDSNRNGRDPPPVAECRSTQGDRTQDRCKNGDRAEREPAIPGIFYLSDFIVRHGSMIGLEQGSVNVHFGPRLCENAEAAKSGEMKLRTPSLFARCHSPRSIGVTLNASSHLAKSALTRFHTASANSRPSPSPN